MKVDKKREKNGAHNHLSHHKRPRASKYSRHVFLCHYDNNAHDNVKNKLLLSGLYVEPVCTP